MTKKFGTNLSEKTLPRQGTPDVLKSNQFIKDLLKIARIQLYSAQT